MSFMNHISTCRPTFAEINLNDLTFNFKSVKSFVGQDIQYMAIVKADGYGHGAVNCALRLEKEGVDWFGVAIPEEGLELRQNGITKSILCLGGFWNGQENILLDHNLTPVLYQIENVQKYDAAAASRNAVASIHIKVDTGMGRIGVRFDELKVFVEGLRQFKNINVEGIMTHFAAADDLEQNEFTKLQIKRFNKAVELFEESGFSPLYKDLANSPGAIAHPDSLGNMVRLGGILYGLGGDVLPQSIKLPELKQILSLKTRIAFLKKVPAGETLGYGRAFRTQRDSMIATIPIGYQDGFPRRLSNRGCALVGGIRVPIIGRISMDWTILDVTDVPNVTVNDEVILIGRQNDEVISAVDLAGALDTISYEITCGISRRVPRIYVETE